jgi:hypothetical protein
VPNLGSPQRVIASKKFDWIYLATSRGFKLLSTSNKDQWSRSGAVEIKQAGTFE